MWMLTLCSNRWSKQENDMMPTDWVRQPGLWYMAVCDDPARLPHPYQGTGNKVDETKDEHGWMPG